MKSAKLFLAVALLASSSFAATPKAYLRGPGSVEPDSPIFLKFNDTVSDSPVVIEQVSGPEKVSLGYWFDKSGAPVYAVGTATIPGLYRFSVIAEGTPEGSDKAIRSYAFWDVNVAGKVPEPDEEDAVEPDTSDGVVAPRGIIPLTIGKPSAEMRLSKGQASVLFSFRPKAPKAFTIATSGTGSWTMDLAGPDDPGDIFASDDEHSGSGANAKIVRTLSPGGTYYVRVTPDQPYRGKAFRVKVTSSAPDPTPTPTPTPTPIPPTPIPPTPTPTPIPLGELKVLFVQESEAPMSEKQLQVWHSGEVEELLIKNTDPGSDGVPGYRKWDKDQDASDDTPEWGEMLAAVKAEVDKTGIPLPVVGIFVGGKGVVKPLPGTVQEMTALIPK